ncbi:hypothetical protein CFSAN002367_27681 [Clostridium botulinum CFSAN002367]|nr:hypothetical protein CFSAN002367_27681 [Clostridium botulinum CFSAN002367]
MKILVILPGVFMKDEKINSCGCGCGCEEEIEKDTCGCGEAEEVVVVAAVMITKSIIMTIAVVAAEMKKLKKQFL